MNDWYNGNLARFALLTPEPSYKERPSPTDELNPAGLVARLNTLHERLPTPTLPAALGEAGPGEDGQGDEPEHNARPGPEAAEKVADVLEQPREFAGLDSRGVRVRLAADRKPERARFQPGDVRRKQRPRGRADAGPLEEMSSRDA